MEKSSQVVQAMGPLSSGMLPKALTILSAVIVAVVMVFAWILSEVSMEDYARPGIEEHPGAPWWKYDPSAEVAMVWGNSGDEVAAELQDRGVTVVEVFPNAVLAALKLGEHEYLEQLGLDVVTVENRTITGRFDFRFDTLYGEPALPASLSVNLEQNPDYDKYILQFVGPGPQEWKTTVESMGVVMFGYLPYNSYIVQMNGSLKDSLMDLYFVQWVGTYQPAYKISGSLLNSTKLWNEVLVGMFPDSRSADVDRISGMIVSAGGQINESWLDEYDGWKLIAHVPRSALIPLLQDSEVSFIEDHDYRDVVF